MRYFHRRFLGTLLLLRMSVSDGHFYNILLNTPIIGELLLVWLCIYDTYDYSIFRVYIKSSLCFTFWLWWLWLYWLLYTYDVTLLDHVETLHVITYLLLQRWAELCIGLVRNATCIFRTWMEVVSLYKLLTTFNTGMKVSLKQRQSAANRDYHPAHHMLPFSKYYLYYTE